MATLTQIHVVIICLAFRSYKPFEKASKLLPFILPKNKEWTSSLVILY